jgi:hypothetical protein
MKKLLESPIPKILAVAVGLAALLMTTPLLAQAVKVELVKNGGKYQLLRDGQPYRVKGAGFAHTEMDSLAALGGNSIRTWSTDDAGPLLDQAHELGITVTLCLYTAPERYGFSYNDAQAVAEQKERIRGEVLKYKDHPAVLTWLIGNELNYDYKNPKVYDAVNDISKMIHELDPNHPTSTALAGFNEAVIDIVNSRAPDLDFISFQVYGQLYDLPRFVKEEDFEDPYFITEWGAIGHWEVGKTSWGAPLEQTSSEKAATYQRGYSTVIEPAAGQNIGDYVFLWGWKQEKTPTWYGIFTQTGEATEVMDVLQHIWTGSWPENRAPQIKPVRLNGKSAEQNVKLKPGKTYRAEVSVTDSDGDPLTYQWQVKNESDSTQLGGDYEEYISSLPGLIADPAAEEIKMKAPSKPGAYRLLVYAYDGQGHAAHANIPFYVED